MGGFIWSGMERKEREENIWRGKIYSPRRRRKNEKEKEESFGEGKLMVTPTNQPTDRVNIEQYAFSKVRKFIRSMICAIREGVKKIDFF